MVVRLPHENIEVKNAAISTSCFFVKRCGIEMGSFLIKKG
jgi:hypothetical protein